MSDESTEASKDERRHSVERQLEGTEAGGEGQTESPAPAFEEPTNVGVDDDEGVEVPSITAQGNEGEGEPGRHETGETNPAGRPVGTSTPRDQSSITPD